MTIRITHALASRFGGADLHEELGILTPEVHFAEARARLRSVREPPEAGREGMSSLPRVTTREVVESFWSAMTANDWERAAAHLADDCVVDWPCSGERIRREHFAEIQARYPAAAEWRFDLHRLIVDGDVAVTELTVTDGEQTARAIVFSEVAGDSIVRQVEYWPEAYEPPAWRADLVERIDPVP